MRNMPHLHVIFEMDALYYIVESLKNEKEWLMHEMKWNAENHD